MNTIRLIVFASLVFCVSPIMAQMEGNGTETMPFLVKTADDLFDIRTDLSAYYKLVNDIDLTGWLQEESPKQGWMPIGTEDLPFTGVFDGNNKRIKGLYINKPDMDNVGLFGYVKAGTINNLCLLNPIVIGNNNVGAIVGKINNNGSLTYNISNNICISGRIEGVSDVGGIAGLLMVSQVSVNNLENTIKGNYSSCNIKGESNLGGIAGEACGYSMNYNSTYTHINDAIFPNISDNSFSGKIVGSSAYLGGIVGKQSRQITNTSYGTRCVMQLNKNIFSGSVFGEIQTNGIFGGYQDGFSTKDSRFWISQCVCAADTISGVSSYRIFSEEYANNYALTSTIVIRNGRVTDVEDDNYNGSSLGLRTLKRKNTYVGMGFDFDAQWAISEGESFPYNINQSAPPTITSCMTIGGNTIVSGTAPADGTIYVFVGDKMYEGNITNGNWDVMLGKLTKGTKIKASADTDSKMPSIFASYEVEDGEDPDIDTPTDSIYVRPASAVRGSKAPLYICLKNEQMATNYSFDLVLPEGVGIDSYVLSSRDSGHSLSMNLEEGTGVYNISVEANPSKEIKGNDGTVFVLMVNTSNLPCGKHFVTIKNAKYSAVSVTAPIVLPDTKAILKIEETTWGDLNGDGLVNISDIMTIIEIMVKQLKK